MHRVVGNQPVELELHELDELELLEKVLKGVEKGVAVKPQLVGVEGIPPMEKGAGGADNQNALYPPSHTSHFFAKNQNPSLGWLETNPFQNEKFLCNDSNKFKVVGNQPPPQNIWGKFLAKTQLKDS